MPTFQFYKNGSKIGQVVGANKDALLKVIQQYADAPSTLVQAQPSPVPGFVDLTSLVHLKQVDCLNLKSGSKASSLFTKDAGSIQSDVDEQLVIVIPFSQAVKLHSVQFLSKDANACPKDVKTFINQASTPSFADLESSKETEFLSVRPNEIMPLKFVRYQSVHQLTLFIINNQQDLESTVMDQLIIYGAPVETTKMSDWNAGNDKH